MDDETTVTAPSGSSSGAAELEGALCALRALLAQYPHILDRPTELPEELQAFLVELQALLSSHVHLATRLGLPALLAHYRELFEFAPDGYLVTDHIGVIKEANLAAAMLLRTGKEFLAGRPLLFFLPESERVQFLSLLNGLLHRGHSIRGWATALRPHRGPVIDVSITVTPFLNPGGEITELRWVLREETERKQAEQAVIAERDFADQLIDLAPVVVLVVDRTGRIVRVNRYLQTLSGYSRRDLFDRDGWRRLLPTDAEDWLEPAIRQVLEGGTGEWGSHRLITKAGLERLVNWSGKPIYRPGEARQQVLVIGVDVTELHRAQKQALQAERLAAIGHVAVGLAHEGRNALQRSQASLDRLVWRLKDQPDLVNLLSRLQRAQSDLVVLFEEVREYSAPLHLDRQPCRLDEIWQEAWDNARSSCPDREASLHAEPGGAALECQADRRRLKQVFRNIFENSLDACPNPVQVTISCHDCLWNGRPALRLSARDNGPGLNPEQQQHIFEPFYTTKSKGTGLGMAIVRRIVEAHGGHIGVGEHPGPGAEIIIYLPRSEP
jgi:PAS domain S-box-containing protein